MREDEYRKDVESKIEELEGGKETEVTEVLEVQAEEPGTAEADQVASESAAPAEVPTAGRASGGKSVPSRGKVNAAFVLGIVGTSLAVLALIVGIAGFSHGRPGFDHRRSGVSITEEMDVESSRSGRGGMRERDEVVIERFEERDGTRGERSQERRHAPERELLEDQELLEEMMEEADTQNS